MNAADLAMFFMGGLAGAATTIVSAALLLGRAKSPARPRAARDEPTYDPVPSVPPDNFPFWPSP